MSESAEVADDFKADLRDLTTNDRYAISNFTVIAKESVPHADAISNVILDHIMETNPQHKLPALYVLDSIVKNIGNPYTLFISPRLYSVFMEAYCVVDSATRRKLDDTLKTWKSPVPGSTDPRPVFPPDVTKRIENALISWKTRTLQQEQEQQRNLNDLLRRRTPGASNQWRNSPTPTQNDPRYPAPVSQGYVQYPAQPFSSTQQPIQPASQIQYQTPFASHQGTGNIGEFSPDVNALHQDTEYLIEQTKVDWAKNPYDDGIRTRLKALLDLQSLLKSQQLPPDQLQAVRSQLSMLQISPRSQSSNSYAVPPNTSTFTDSTPLPIVNPTNYQSQPLGPNSLPYSITQPSQSVPAPSQLPSASNMPSADFLSNLLASAGRTASPVAQAYSAPNTTIQPAQAASHVTPSVENPLLAQLRAAGILSNSTPSSQNQNTTPVSNGLQPSYPVTSSGPSGPSSVDLSQLLRSARTDPINDIQLTPASLKQHRPHLMSRLYESQPNQCLTCGKRYPGTENGKAQKARHLDWHFKTNQRLVEAGLRGQSRSWYVDENEWISYRDDGEGNEESTTNGMGLNAHIGEASSRTDPKSKTIPVPSDSNLRTLPCPICQEKFEQSWSEELQDFVFVDAIKVGGRIYHASCYADYRKDEGNTPARNSTPDSVLGKRKAETNVTGPSPAKIRREGEV